MKYGAFLFFFWAVFICPVIAAPQHAIALYGEPKYSAGFAHFDYVNTAAPQGGEIKFGVIGSFDSFNPFILKGTAPSGILLTYDTLMKSSDDEPFTQYGLVADKIDLPSDRSWVAFHIDPRAVFSDNSPVRPEDVAFSFQTLKEKGAPSYRYYYEDVQSAHVLPDGWIRFDFKKGAQNRELPLILGQLPVLPEKYWADKDFTQTTSSVPLAGGPYLVDSFDMGKHIIYKKNPAYWAKDLNVNRGYYNFQNIKYEYFRDSSVAFEAFKSGAFDLRFENEAKRWAALANDKNVKAGRLKMVAFPNHMPSGMQGFVYNTRRDIFKNPNTRRALAYAFDFDWVNKYLFHSFYQRTNSYFDNSVLKAPPLPSEDEARLLAPFKGILPPEIWTTPYEAPKNSGNFRRNLSEALHLLLQAGWTVENGVLVDQNHRPFSFEILLDAGSSATWERVVLPFIGRLKRLGINARIRTVDSIQYKNRLDNYDFDMVVGVFPQSLSPGNEQRSFWGSASADITGSYNYTGIQSKAVDFLIEKIITAASQQQLQTAVHALDRVLLWHHLVIPHWYTPVHRYTFWDKFGYPDATPSKGENTMTWWQK